MRKLLFFGMSVFYMLAATFCNYTPVVYQYLNSEENYIEIEAKISSVKYQEEGYSYIYINLTELSRYVGFTGDLPDTEDADLLENTVVEIKVVNENAKLLKERGFFDEATKGDIVNIRTTCWIYKEEDRHYLAHVELKDKQYLSFEEGFENIGEATRGFKEIEQ